MKVAPKIRNLTGNLEFRLSVHNSSTSFIIYERWTDIAAVVAYENSPVVKENAPVLLQGASHSCTWVRPLPTPICLLRVTLLARPGGGTIAFCMISCVAMCLFSSLSA